MTTKMFPAFINEFAQQQAHDLETMLKWHDWHYEMSDDHRVYARGLAQWESIKQQIEVVNTLVPGLGDDIYACNKQ
jgi:hypothetical protein